MVVKRLEGWGGNKKRFITIIIIFNNVYVCIRGCVCIYTYILTVGFVGLWGL